MPSLTSLRSLFCQQIDPIAFLKAQRSQSVQESGLLWLVRLGMGLTVVALLAVIGLLNQDYWRLMVPHVVSSFTLMQMGIGVAIMVTGYARFWLTYLFSPPLLLITLLCGLTPVTPLGWLGWLAFSIALGHGVAVAGVVWVQKRVDEMEAYPPQQREGGLPADMPRLHWRIRVRVLRLAIAGICLFGALLIFWFMPLRGREPLALLGLAIGAAGCLSLDATLLCWLGLLPLVDNDETRQQWRTTYSGRFALFVPTSSPPLTPPNTRGGTLLGQLVESMNKPPPLQIHQLFTTNDDPAKIVLTLLRSSCLGPTVRRAVAILPPVEAHHLLLNLSLQAGGATAIIYLQPALPSLPLVAKSYGNLARQAAKPIDVQQWLSTLKESSDSISSIDQEIAQLLAEVHHALYSYKHTEQVDLAHDKLTHFVHTLYGKPKSNDSLAASWPIALLTHLDSHRTQLHGA